MSVDLEQVSKADPAPTIRASAAADQAITGSINSQYPSTMASGVARLMLNLLTNGMDRTTASHAR